jgi:tetratricopeptide (TPR) repeat protein
MKIKAFLISASIMVTFAFSSYLFAAGSGSQPASETRPSVTFYNAGVKLMKQGDYEKAEKKFKSALKMNSKMAEAYNNLGYSLRMQGAANYKEALGLYNRAIELKPDLAEAYMYRGVLHMLMGQEAKALEDHRTLTGLDRNLADALQAAIASGEEPDGLDGLAKSW